MKNKLIFGLGIAIILTMVVVTPTTMLQSTQAAINRVGGDVTAGGGTHLVELEKSTMHRAPMATSGNSVYVAWPSNKTGSYEIMFRASSDNGKTFGPKVNLSNSTGVDSVDEEISASGNSVYVTWWELQQNGTREPIFIASHDNGKTFGQKIVINSNSTGSSS
jgi:hypothetical protein